MAKERKKIMRLMFQQIENSSQMTEIIKKNQTELWPVWLNGRASPHIPKGGGFISQSRAHRWITSSFPAQVGVCVGGN